MPYTDAFTAEDPKQAAEYHKGLLDDAMKGFDDARTVFEEAQKALFQAAGQVHILHCL